MTQLFRNNVSAFITATVPTASQNFLQFADSSVFPILAAGETFIVTVETTTGVIECMNVTANNTVTDRLTVVRGYDGTVAVGSSGLVSGSRCEMRVTAATLDGFLQKSGGIMTGDLNLAGNDITNAYVVQPEIRGGAWNGSDGSTGKQIVVPPASADPAIGGSRILTDANLASANFQAIPSVYFTPGMILMWSGALGSIPAGWALCNGSVGTPNLTGRFIVQYDPGDAALDAIGKLGAATAATDAGSAHTHTNASTVLTIPMIPAHGHDLWVQTQGGGTSTASLVTENVGVAGDGAGGSGPPYAEYVTNNFNGGPGSYRLIKETGGGDPLGGGAATGHSHTNTSESAHTHTLTALRPKYYVLAYIMKT